MDNGRPLLLGLTFRIAVTYNVRDQQIHTDAVLCQAPCGHLSLLCLRSTATCC
jgi:hypothetical protein